MGVIQGIAEFLPVSSSGHLVVAQRLFGLKDIQVSFDVFLHAGTLLAVIVYFFKDIIGLLKENKLTLIPMSIATIITVAIVFPCMKLFKSAFLNIKVVAVCFLIAGIWLILTSVVKINKGQKKRPGILQAALIGLAQGIAVLPGISRSGATISTGILAGVEKEAAFRFSFLLSIPIVIGAVMYETMENPLEFGGSLKLYITGTVAAFLAGLLALRLLAGFVKKGQLHFFGIYCILMGLITFFIR